MRRRLCTQNLAVPPLLCNYRMLAGQRLHLSPKPLRPSPDCFDVLAPLSRRRRSPSHSALSQTCNWQELSEQRLARLALWPAGTVALLCWRCLLMLDKAQQACTLTICCNAVAQRVKCCGRFKRLIDQQQRTRPIRTQRSSTCPVASASHAHQPRPCSPSTSTLQPFNQGKRQPFQHAVFNACHRLLCPCTGGGTRIRSAVQPAQRCRRHMQHSLIWGLGLHPLEPCAQAARLQPINDPWRSMAPSLSSGSGGARPAASAAGPARRAAPAPAADPQASALKPPIAN